MIDRFLDLACLTYTGEDHPRRREEALALLRAHPELPSDDLAVAATLGRAADVRRLLAIDPSRVRAPVGPRGWEPLLYLCYSRVVDGSDWLGTVEALLAAGADPRAHFHQDGTCLFTALTGAFGEGESGPVNQPEHPAGLSLARRLLDAGADPNDAQALYNRMFAPGAACLALLVEYGLRPTARITWSTKDDRPRTLHHQLMWAARHGHPDRVEILLRAGVDPRQPDPDGVMPWEVAWLCGHREIARRLEDSGAFVVAMDEVDQLAAALNARQPDESRLLLGRHPDLLSRMLRRWPELPIDAGRRGDAGALWMLLDLGVDPNHTTDSTALQQALWHGHVEAARLLLARGADPALRDPVHGADALGWARHGGHPDAITLLEGGFH